MPDAAVNILLLEDESAHAEAIRRAFAASDLKAEVRIVGTLREFHEAVAARSPSIVLMDMVLPDGRALDALPSSPEDGSFPILVMTSFGNEQTAVEALRSGALDYIVKSPEAFATMPHAVGRALREWNVLQEHKRAAAALRESEERFRTLYENSTLGLYRTDPAGRIVLANLALVKMLGYSSFKELSGRSLEKDGFAPSYPRAQFIELIEKEGAVKGLESAWKRRDGTTIFVRESARAIRGPEGLILYFDGTVEDITDRTEAEEELAYEQSLLRALMDNATDQVYFKDMHSRFLRISKAQAERFGLSDPAQAESKTDFDFFGDEHARQAFLDEQEIIKTGRPLVDQEEKETLPNGRVAWVSTTKVPLRDQRGQIIGTFGISRDITERKKAEEAVRSSEAQLSNALQMAHAGHWVYDVGEDTFTFNDNFYRIFRTTAAEMGGYKMSSADYARRFCHPDDHDLVGREVRAAIESADPSYDRQIEHRILYAGGQVGTITVRFFIVKDAQGRTVKTHGVNQDITERKRMEESLRQAEENFRRSLDESPLGARIVTEQGETLYRTRPSWTSMATNASRK